MTPVRIKALRKSLGLSAEAFARSIGISQGRLIRKWEAGDIVPGGTAITLMEAAEAMPSLRQFLLLRSAPTLPETTKSPPPG